MCVCMVETYNMARGKERIGRNQLFAFCSTITGGGIKISKLEQG